MDQIKSYVDAMFAGLPNTGAVAEMKQNILENMQERYQKLLSEGKSENEALGAVISQFGNINEVKKELGIDDTVQQTNAPIENAGFPIGVIPFIPAFFFPPLFLYFIIKYKDWISALIFVCAVSIYLIIGFTLNLWHPGWIVLPVSFLIIIFRLTQDESRLKAKKQNA
jgi:VIT1/CCC1 family predicted Fe2+/Mn2+ transporter